MHLFKSYYQIHNTKKLVNGMPICRMPQLKTETQIFSVEILVGLYCCVLACVRACVRACVSLQRRLVIEYMFIFYCSQGFFFN